MKSKKILQNEILNLPKIKDTPIPTWLAEAKLRLADLLGFNNGYYYDVLAANAYSLQLNEELRPLSEKQIKNIESYWKNGEIAKILLRKNNKVAELAKLKLPTTVNDISSVAKDKVIETILAKYKNRVVFIDLWATWCAPCLDAMQEFRSTKDEFHDKNIAFVYLTNGSSPKKLWEEKINGIGGEHYYLDPDQWEFMMDQFKFEAIPSYLLYDKSGLLKNKFTAFPGSKVVKDMISELL
ncbi:TlpA family protein disulfide reductase [Pedobacter sp. SL55]|uniref:TlpA family protein disulfide reductase n=1 Tax=Pedobacter sp. SL55 TaxID=2995161 RepID=UPI00226FA53E|nr:TlpA disulfide reductase family protein [Pedobacter sp. SL55]WAC41398.1 TlpA disulfide reductase family protein [Pedobacter sp. SL55]